MSLLARGLALIVIGGLGVPSAAFAAPRAYGEWSGAIRVESIPGTDSSFNGATLDGCPFISRDGTTFFMASRRLTGAGDAVTDINIWAATRGGAHDPWGAPVLVGPPVSIDTTSAADPQVNDFCPTLDRNGRDFYFVSNRLGGCGGDDMYRTRLRADTVNVVENLGCDVNTAANEASPFPLKKGPGGPVLYFSSNLTGLGDIYVSNWHAGRFAGRELVAGVNTASTEGHPNVRRDGLELFFFSNRPGSLGADIWSASRRSTRDPWSGAVNLGPSVNGTEMSSETRPSLSWDGTTLYFGSNRTGGEGDSDHYVVTRERLTGTDDD